MCACVFGEQRGKIQWSFITYPLFQLGATLRIRGGKNYACLLVGCQEGPYGSNLVNGKDSDRQRLKVEDILVEGRGCLDWVRTQVWLVFQITGEKQ